MEEKKYESLLESIEEEQGGSSVELESAEVVVNNEKIPMDGDQEFVYTSEWLKENTSIHGWLSFFLFVLGLGGIFSGIVPLFSIKAEEYANNYFLIFADVLPGLSMLAVSIYTIYAFNARKPNAVFYGKVYVALVLITNVLALIVGEFETKGFNTQKHAIRSVVWSIIWFLYLVNSVQVEEIIPSSFRRVTRRDWLIVAGIIVVPVVCFLIGYTLIDNVIKERERNESFLLSSNLSENERTDGRIIFTIPTSFFCSEEDVAIEDGLSLKVFNLENESKGTGILCSDYDNDVTRSNFDSYRVSWKDPDTSMYLENDVDEGERTIRGNRCFYKITSYDINGTLVYWRFMMLFDKSTDKVALLSFYDQNADTEYIDELLNSIRFR